MRLYRHADNKAALLEAVTELVMEDFSVVPMADGDWERSLRSAANSFRSIALAHPRMVQLLLMRQLSTPLELLPSASLRSLENLLAVLSEAGFDDLGVLRAYRFFTGFLAGHVLHEMQESLESEKSDDELTFHLGRLSEVEFPHTRALGPALAAYDGGDELVIGLEIVLEGLRSQLKSVATSRQPVK